ncbi:hypothetical protein [Gramella sp. MAR_2010_147]|uniref:hypothetical protein n=1 Tax=Gramella sp. MAR_2010_147 TaxID=1250205 RepID=UPI000B7F4D9C|nr:hypothetical protein [Gramella sp. MAR_2010_147]
MEREIFKNLSLKVSEYHSNTSSEVLKDKILKSVYFKKIETRIVSNKKLLWVIGCIEIAILVLSVLSKKFREVNQVWIIFSVLLFVFVVASLRTHYLKNEKQDLLNWD